MNPLQAHQQFYQHTSALANELCAIENSLKGKEQQLLQGIESLMLAVRKASAVKRPKAVQELVLSYFNNVDKVLAAWQKKVANYDAGLTFREQFGDSLLVFVYGKVKAGKSALGNYVASGRGKPDEAWLEQLANKLHKPEFFVAEQNTKFAENINFKQGFQVGSVETTSCIQGFRVPGMTWVDSPGLHSVNSENGDLAQKYVDSADLIIYPMNTAQPGRQSDLQELEGLLKAGKRILVLITRCDEWDEDIDAAGNLVSTKVMKPAQSRHDQEHYVQQKLDELCASLGITDADTAVLSVSVDFAESNGNSCAAMHESGMQALFDKLQDILQSEGIDLKKQVPTNNLQHFYQQLLDEHSELSLLQLQQPLEAAKNQLNALQGQLEQISEQAKCRIALDFSYEMDRLVEAYADNGDMQGLEEKLQDVIQAGLFEHYQQPMQVLYQQAIETFTSSTEDMGLCVDLSFENKQKAITVDISRRSAAMGSGIGTLLFGAIGFFVGGSMGAAVGASLGGLAGGAAGSAFNQTEKRIISVGDNREDIKDVLLNKAEQQVDLTIALMNDKTSKELLLPLEAAIEQVLQQTNTFKNSIQEQCHV